MSFDLLREMQANLQTLFAGTAYRNPAVEDESAEGAFIQPRIYIGALPPKRSRGRDNEDFPFLIVRATQGEDQNEYSELNVEVIAGVYTTQDEEAGVNEIQNIIDRVRIHLLQHPLLASRFELQMPMNWSAGTDEDRNQPHPYYVGNISTTWRYVRPQRLNDVGTELGTYGSGYL